MACVWPSDCDEIKSAAPLISAIWRRISSEHFSAVVTVRESRLSELLKFWASVS